MSRNLSSLPYICAQCRRSQASLIRRNGKAPLSTTARRSQQQPQQQAAADNSQNDHAAGVTKDGAMSRRLQDLTDENLATGGRSARKAVEEAGFDEELKQKLLNRIADASFRSENVSAFAQADMPSTAGKITRETAAAQPWMGTETLEDAALRMLTDAHKPMKVPFKVPTPRGVPIKIETGRKPAQQTGARLANARDKSSMYSFLKDDSMSAEDKRKFRKELKDRFSPGARATPTTLRGLESLANERIEDAIARGQFKNLPRGKKLERDYNMSSPFIDTTSYFLNKIIKKQEIVPPWIEKQQELVSTVTKFRARLRSDWRRHAARVIASGGGGLETLVRRAEQYAEAERIVNPPAKRKVEKINTVDDEGHVSQITLAGELKPSQDGGQPVETVTVSEGPPTSTTVSNASPEVTAPPELSSSQNTDNPYINAGAVHPFRDPTWEASEQSYLALAITNLNNLTRSYNLMAPDLAKKPYFSLERELRSAYADVAPQLPDEIRTRAAAPRVKVEVVGHREGGILEKFSREEKVRVYDEQKPQYGFKEFWKDLWDAKA